MLALYARGLAVREIQDFLLQTCGTEVGPDFISTVTDPARHRRQRGGERDAADDDHGDPVSSTVAFGRDGSVVCDRLRDRLEL